MAIPNGSPGNNCIEVWSCGPNGICFDGDDQLIGTGSVNAQGLFVVNLNRPLILGERIYAVDVCNDLTGLPITVGAGEVAPAMSPQVLLLLTGVLTLVGALGLRRLRMNP